MLKVLLSYVPPTAYWPGRPVYAPLRSRRTARGDGILDPKRSRRTVDAGVDIVLEYEQDAERVGGRQAAGGECQGAVEQLLLQGRLVQVHQAGTGERVLDRKRIADILCRQAVARRPANHLVEKTGPVQAAGAPGDPTRERLPASRETSSHDRARRRGCP